MKTKLLKEEIDSMMQGWLDSDVVNEIECPRCKEPPGRRCIRKNGKKAIYIHLGRKALFIEKLNCE